MCNVSIKIVYKITMAFFFFSCFIVHFFASFSLNLFLLFLIYLSFLMSKWIGKYNWSILKTLWSKTKIYKMFVLLCSRNMHEPYIIKKKKIINWKIEYKGQRASVTNISLVLVKVYQLASYKTRQIVPKVNFSS